MKHIIFISFILFTVITGEATAKEKEPTTKGKEVTVKEKQAATKENKLTDKEMEAMVKEALGKGKEATAKEMEATAKEMDATTKKMEALTKKMEAMAKEQEQQVPVQPQTIPPVIQGGDPLMNIGPKGSDKTLTVAPAPAAAAAAAAVCAGTQITDTGTNETATITFNGSLSNNKIANIGGLIFRNNPGQPNLISNLLVAHGFSNLPNNGPTRGLFVNGGSWSGQLLTGWGSSGVVQTANGPAVTFTYVTSGNVTDFPTPSTDDNQFILGITRTQGTAGGALSTLLTGNTVCDANATYDRCVKHPSPGCQPTVMGIQEEHRSGGQLWDYKRGPSSSIDPTKQVGNWSISGSGTGTVVNYTYLGGGGSGSYTVFDNLDGTYNFCKGATPVATVTIVPSGSGCSGFSHGAP